MYAPAKVFVFLLLIVNLSACASRQLSMEEELAAQDPQVLFEHGQQAQKKGDQNEALTAYVQLAEREDEWGQKAKLAIARLAFNNGDYHEALRGYNLLLRNHPDSLEAQEGRGLALLALGDNEEARLQLEDVYKQDKTRWRTLNGLGIVADLKGYYRAAARWYGLALEAGGPEVMVLNNATYSLIMAGEYQEAETMLTSALRRHPKSKRLRNNLAIAQARQRRYQEALNSWQVNLDKADALNNVGYIAMLNGDRDKAREFLNQALNAAPQHRPRAATNLDAI